MGSPVSQEMRSKLVESYLAGKNLEESASEFGLSSKATHNALLAAGLRPRKNDGWNRRYALDERFFEKIDTESKAYWLGFITADGGIYEPLYRLSIRLARKDRTHLLKFAQSLGYQKPSPVVDYISSSGNGNRHLGSRIAINSKLMIEDLRVLHVTQNKTFSAAPWEGTDLIMRHYWRGLFDGDGCISNRGKRGSNRGWRASLVGTFAVCDGFRRFVLSRLGFDAKISPHGRSSECNGMVYENRR